MCFILQFSVNTKIKGFFVLPPNQLFFRLIWSDLYLISGTVFNQIIVWKPHLKSLNQNCIIKRFDGHNGVIFDLQFNMQYKVGFNMIL